MGHIITPLNRLTRQLATVSRFPVGDRLTTLVLRPLVPRLTRAWRSKSRRARAA